MLRVPKGTLIYELSPTSSPRARIAPGTRLLVEAEDALSGQIRTAADRPTSRRLPYSKPVNGPIFVEGATGGRAGGDDPRHPAHDRQCATYTALRGR